MRTLTRRVLPLAVVLATAFVVGFAIARARDNGPSQRGVSVPGVAPEAVNAGSPPRVGTLGDAAPLPGLRAVKRAVPVSAPKPAAPAPVAPAPKPVTPKPAPTPVAPVPTPAPIQAPLPKPQGKKFQSSG